MTNKETKACLRESISELRGLIIEHHSYNVMKDEHCTCPVCTQPSWDAVLNNAAKLEKAGDEQPAPLEPEELKALASATCSAVWNRQLLAHPFHMAIYELMDEIEKLPASEQETKVVIMAGALQNRVAEMRAEASKQAKCLREQSAECFPEENGQKHFARLIMEGVADELDAAFNPPNDKAEARRE